MDPATRCTALGVSVNTPWACCTTLLLSSQFWPMPSMSRGVINCAKQFLSHPFRRTKSFDQWAVDRDPALTSTTSAKIGKTAIPGGVENEAASVRIDANRDYRIASRSLKPASSRLRAHARLGLEKAGLSVHVESTDGSMNQVDFKKRTKPNDKRLGCIYD